MKALLATTIVLLFAHGSVSAQTGDAQAGKTLWEGPNTGCRNCHGTKGEGGVGPDLAGRKLTIAQFTRTSTLCRRWLSRARGDSKCRQAHRAGRRWA